MKIRLREITLHDGEILVKWRNNPSVLAHCLNQKPITIESNESFFHENIETNKYVQYMSEILDEVTGETSEPIATVYLKNIDKTNKRCELCFFISDKQEWNTEAHVLSIKMLLKKAFDEMGMHKIYSYAFYKFINEASLLKKAGFTMEAILREEVINEKGEFDDIVRFSISINEWKNIHNE